MSAATLIANQPLLAIHLIVLRRTGKKKTSNSINMSSFTTQMIIFREWNEEIMRKFLANRNTSQSVNARTLHPISLYSTGAGLGSERDELLPSHELL